MTPEGFSISQALLQTALNLKLQLLQPPFSEPPEYNGKELWRLLQDQGVFAAYNTGELAKCEPRTPYLMRSRLGYAILVIRPLEDLREGILLFGPFLENQPTAAALNRVQRQLGLPARLRSTLGDVWISLPVVPAETVIRLGAQVALLWGAQVDVDRTMAYDFQSWRRLKSSPPDFVHDLTLEMAETHSRQRAALMRDISRGDAHDAQQTALSLMAGLAGQPLGEQKKWLQIFNTQCVCAIRNGCVHPFYQEELYRQIMAEIDACADGADIGAMLTGIVARYCALTQNTAASRYSGLVSKAIQYIDLHFDGPLTLRDVAAALGRSESYLANQFKKETHLTVTRYINAKKVEEAAWLLTGSDRRIQDAAAQVGINDTSYFCRLFKRQFGMTPQQFCTINR